MAAISSTPELGRRAAIYARLSRRGAAGKVVSVAEQEAREAERIRRDGRVHVGTYVDDGVSAWDPTAHRPDWNALLDAIASGEIDYVYTVASDRTTRQTLEGELILATCARHGVRLVEDGVETDPRDDDQADMRRIKTMFDARYSRTISRKVKVAREVAAMSGRPHPGPRPFGYNADRRTLHPIEGPAYRELFERVIRGEGLVSIARDWEQQGITNRHGQRFATASLVKLIRSPRAIGMRQHRGEIVGPGDWEPIVTADVQAQAIAAMRSRTRLRVVGPKRAPRLLSSLVVCGNCGRAMRARHPKGQAAQYLCDSTKAGACGTVLAKADAVDTEVERRFLAVLTDPDTRVAIDRLRAQRPDIATLLRNVEALQAELDGYTADARTGAISRREYLAIREGVQARLDRASAALREATEAAPIAAVSPDDVLRGWDRASLDTRRQWMVAFIERVVLQSAGGRARRGHFDVGRVEIAWRV